MLAKARNVAKDACRRQRDAAAPSGIQKIIASITERTPDQGDCLAQAASGKRIVCCAPQKTRNPIARGGHFRRDSQDRQQGGCLFSNRSSGARQIALY
jgi:hypothetical protein